MVVLLGLLALGLIVRNVLVRSERVLGWLLAATVVAALLHPVVAILQRWMRRSLALLVTFVGLGVVVGAVVYGAVDDLRAEIERLQREAPAAAERIEASERFGQAARDFGLAQRVQEFVDELPSRLAGGDAPEALRAAATRSVAYLVALVLTVFLLLHGPRLAGAATGVIVDPARRQRLQAVLLGAYRRWWDYVVGALGIGVLAGLGALALARLTELPGPIALGLLVGLFALVPSVGVLVGGAPLLLFAVGLRPGSASAVVVLAGLVAFQVLEVLVLRPALDRRSLHVGPAITTVVAIVAFDLAGIGGVFVGLAIVVFALAVADELAPGDQPEPAAASADG